MRNFKKLLLGTLTITLLSLVTQAKTYCVIVGVSVYDNPINNLRYADDDARAFYNYMTSNGGATAADITLLIDADATKANIKDAIETQFNKATETDKVVFFFSGHGNVGKFVCYDAPNGGNYLYHTEVKTAFKNCKATVKFCFADACMSGSIKSVEEKKPSKEKLEKGYNGLKGGQDNIVVFMSSRPTETSQENAAVQQGWFAYYLISGLKGSGDINNDKNITILEIYSYVRSKVKGSTSDKQTPIIFGNFNKNQTIVSL
jgi:uncharacterized caspase-like protein